MYSSLVISLGLLAVFCIVAPPAIIASSLSSVSLLLLSLGPLGISLAPPVAAAVLLPALAASLGLAITAPGACPVVAAISLAAAFTSLVVSFPLLVSGLSPTLSPLGSAPCVSR